MCNSANILGNAKVVGSTATQIFSHLKMNIKSNLFFLHPLSSEIYQITLCFRLRLFMEINHSDPCEVNIIFINGKIAEETSKIACLNYAELLDMWSHC